MTEVVAQDDTVSHLLLNKTTPPNPFLPMSLVD